MKDKFELTNKVALITGGGSGIGLGIAAAYIALGAKVAITGRNITKLEAAKLALGDHCFIYVNDVTKKDTHEKLVETIEKEVGPIEILVNNAGIHNKKPSIEVTDAEVNQYFDRVAQQNFNQNTKAMDAYLAKIGSSPTSLKRQILGELFDLTPAEANLATLLARGLSLAQVSSAQTISQHTARAQLKSIFAKTGVSRQAELVRLVLKSVASLG